MSRVSIDTPCPPPYSGTPDSDRPLFITILIMSTYPEHVTFFKRDHFRSCEDAVFLLVEHDGCRPREEEVERMSDMAFTHNHSRILVPAIQKTRKKFHNMLTGKALLLPENLRFSEVKNHKYESKNENIV